MENSPYPGSRSFARGDVRKLYGRDEETRALFRLIDSERLVLAYGPSGAGLTSLLNARVIPALEAQHILVLPVARVGYELPPGTEPELVDNSFVFSLLQSLSVLGAR